MQQPTELILPDLFSLCPFSWSGPNPLYAPSNRESTEWMLNYGIFADEKRARLDVTLPELLGAYAYPYADAKGLRIANDFMMILFTIDEITDVQDALRARGTYEIFTKALTGKSGDDNSPVTLFTKDFLNRMSGTPEEVLREKGLVLSVEEYTHHRRDTGGLRPAFVLIEVLLGFNLPAEVFEDSNFMRVSHAANDMICWSNDIYSFAMEYARGIEGSNAVTVIMQEKSLSLQEAVDHVAELFKDFADTMTSCKESIRSFGREFDVESRYTEVFWGGARRGQAHENREAEESQIYGVGGVG